MADTPKRKSTTKSRKAPRQAAQPAHDPGRPSEEDIRRRAYELYQQRGGEPGHEQEDWDRAERELRSEQQ